MRKVKGNKRAEAGLHVGDEEIHPVEPVAALWRGWCVERSSGVAIARNGAVEARFSMSFFGHRFD
jgi:hypothetical protein